MDEHVRHRRRVNKKGAKQAHGRELHRVAKAGMIAAERREDGPIGRVKVGTAGKLVGGGVDGKAAIAGHLVRSEEGNGHAMALRVSREAQQFLRECTFSP